MGNVSTICQPKAPNGTATRAAVIEVAGVTLDLDEVLVRDAVKWSVHEIGGRLCGMSELEVFDVAELRSLAQRLESLADLHERPIPTSDEDAG